MAGHKGVELWGPYAQQETVRAAGKKHGLKQAGRLAYFSTPSEGGWMAYPLPAAYTDENLLGFRKWLPATSWPLKRAAQRLPVSQHRRLLRDAVGYGCRANFDDRGSKKIPRSSC